MPNSLSACKGTIKREKNQIYSTCTVEITSNPQLKKYNAFISGIARQNATRLPAGLSATALHGAALALFAAVNPL